MAVQFSRSVMSSSLWPHGLQHTRPHYPSTTPGGCSNSCPLSQWYHPTISSSVIPFSSHLRSFPASGSFQMSQFFTSDGQSIGVSASTSVLPMNTQDWSPLGWTDWISLQSKVFIAVKKEIITIFNTLRQHRLNPFLFFLKIDIFLMYREKHFCESDYKICSIKNNI